MLESQQINELAAALAKAQGQFKNAPKKAKNPFFGSMYADLGACMDAVRDALSANGLAVTQCPGNVEGETLHLTTKLIHSSGQWLQADQVIPIGKHYNKRGEEIPINPQIIGSCITYARRYGLCAIVGLATEDDDGNAVSQQPEPKPKPARRADNEKAQYQITVSEVKPTREVTNNGKHFAEFVVTGNMPDGTLRESFGYAPITDDGAWTSDRFALASANVGKRVAVFATLGKSGKWMIDTLSEVANG